MTRGASQHTTAEAARLPPVVWATAALSLVLHLLPRPGYGFHRDELLYLAMGDHLDLFRMQFPPVIALLAEFARLLPLNLLTAIHLLSGLAAAAAILLAARIARRLGGAAPAQALAALAVLSTPFVMRAGSMLQPLIFEYLWWAAGTLARSRAWARAPGSPPRSSPSPRCWPSWPRRSVVTWRAAGPGWAWDWRRCWHHPPSWGSPSGDGPFSPRSRSSGNRSSNG
jgi:hypothetical protein